MTSDRSSTNQPVGVVAHGRLVVLRFGDDAPETYLFGNVEDRHPEAATLTDESPVGREIIGTTAGAVVEVIVGATREFVTVLEVREVA